MHESQMIRLESYSQTKHIFLNNLKCFYDENRILQIKGILRHKHVVRIRIKMLFTVSNDLFSFQRSSSF